MWMRSCAVCKALLRKPRLWDSIRCQCGWEWEGRRGLRETYRVPSANKEVCLRKHRLLTLLPLRGFHINEHWNMIAEVSPKLERIQLRLI